MVLGESPGRSGHRFFAVAYLLTKGAAQRSWVYGGPPLQLPQSLSRTHLVDI
jgi:hypothetical protein